MTTTTDAVIVGAGVIGCATALELARAGLRVCVVDQLSGPGRGSTAASSAIIRYNYSTLTGVTTSWESKHFWQRWREYLEAPSRDNLASFRRTGLAMLDVPVAPRSLFVPLLAEVGVPYEEWSPAELEARIPGIDAGCHFPPKRIDDDAFWIEPAARLGAVYTPDAGFVDDPQLAAMNLADAAARRGVKFMFAGTVIDVLRADGRVAGVALATGESISASIVVNAAGPWSTRLNELAGVTGDFQIHTRPLRQEVHVVGSPPGYDVAGQPGPVIADLDLGTYMRGAPGGQLLVGGSEPQCDPMEWLADPDEAHPHATSAVYGAQMTRAARRFPALRVPHLAKGIAGVYDVSDDWVPIYDRTALPGYYVAIGTSGNQFKNAPVVGQIMAALIRAVENGQDHDAEPVLYTCVHSGRNIELADYSRRRTPNPASTGTVMG